MHCWRTPVVSSSAGRATADFQNLHRNKRAISLNLKDSKGLEVFNRLVGKADVVVENFRPDVKAKLGTDYESVKKVNRLRTLSRKQHYRDDWSNSWS
jgi:crotonobetainyl-CoA:carnitine CoA-transferase CaiB-like acyl-CoA transferase